MLGWTSAFWNACFEILASLPYISMWLCLGAKGVKIKSLSQSYPVLLRQLDASRGNVMCGHRVIMATFQSRRRKGLEKSNSANTWPARSCRLSNRETVDVCEPPGSVELPSISPGTPIIHACFYPACPVLTMTLDEAPCATPWESLHGSFHHDWVMHTQHTAFHSVTHTFPSAKRQSYYFFFHIKKTSSWSKKQTLLMKHMWDTQKEKIYSVSAVKAEGLWKVWRRRTKIPGSDARGDMA